MTFDVDSRYIAGEKVWKILRSTQVTTSRPSLFSLAHTAFVDGLRRCPKGEVDALPNYLRWLDLSGWRAASVGIFTLSAFIARTRSGDDWHGVPS